MSGVRLRELRPPDADTYHALMQRNAAHLTRLGDYTDEVAASPAEVASRFAEAGPVAVSFGVYLHDELVGVAALVPVAPPRFGLGYWLSEHVTGRGIATTAVARLLDYARTELSATDVFAGVTYGNRRSEALLARLGFEVVAEFDAYRRFHLSLQPENAADPSAPS